MIDVVFPKNNEEEFIELAEKLGIKSLVFVYDSNKKFYKSKDNKIKIFNGLEINDKNKGLKNTADITFAKGDDLNNRQIVESVKPDVIYSAEGSRSKDFIHQRASGFNHVIARIAKEKKVIVGFNFSDLLQGNDLVIGRMMQNILLCRKFKLDVCIASFAKDPYDMRFLPDAKAFFETVGMSDVDSKKALSTIQERISLNLRKKSGSYLAEGLEVLD